MKILITGGAGFIGSHVARFHIEKGDEVIVLDNLLTGSKDNLSSIKNNPLLQYIHADIVSYDFSSIPTVDLIYHLACPASPIQYKKYPVETLLTSSQGTYNVVEFMKRSQSKSLVFSSTSEVYGDPLIHPQIESYWGNVNPNGVRSCYDEGKRYAEALLMTYVRTYNLDIRFARIFNTYGPNMEKDDGRVVSNFVNQALSQHPITIYGKGTQTRSFCFVSDMVRGLYALGITPNIKGEVINIGNPDERSVEELAILIKNLVHSQSEIIHEHIDADDPQKRKPDISKAQKMLKWNPEIPLEKGLLQTITYFQKRFS
ncbi:MAG: NAD-dependent epimerase/dehydratase family protein [Candidatus Roizmanbacteria bacterium]